MMFRVSGGSVIGTEHRHSGTNKQDSFGFTQTEDVIIAVVCDGVSASPQSEVGAHLGVQLLQQAILQELKHDSRYFQTLHTASIQTSERFWNTVEQDVASLIRVLARSMPGSLRSVLTRYFSFTTVAAVITPTGSVFVTFGDGVVVTNGDMYAAGPFAQNAPPCLAYTLLDVSQYEGNGKLAFVQAAQLPTPLLSSFLIGSDGVLDLARLEHSCYPGKPDIIGNLAQFWTQEKFVTNPDQINRTLRLINRDVLSIDPTSGRFLGNHRGLLRDDTTLIVGQREVESAVPTE